MSIQNTRTVIGLKEYDTSFLINVVDEVKDKLEELGTLTLDYEGNGVYYFLYTNVAGVDVYLRIDDDKLPFSPEEDYIVGSIEDKMLQQSILNMLITNCSPQADNEQLVDNEEAVNSQEDHVDDLENDHSLSQTEEHSTTWEEVAEIARSIEDDLEPLTDPETNKTEEEAVVINTSLSVNKKIAIAVAVVLTVAVGCLVFCSRD